MASTEIYPGDFILAAKVTDYDQAGETQEFIGKIKDDVTTSADYETAESNLKEERTTIRDRTHRSIDLEMVIAQSPGIPALDVVGIDTSDNTTDSLEGTEMECLRLYIYRDEPPTDGTTGTPTQVKEYFRVTFAIDEDNLPTGEHAELSMTAFVNNGWKLGKGGGTV